MKLLESKDAGTIHRLSVNTSLGGAERSRAREVVVKLNTWHYHCSAVGLTRYNKKAEVYALYATYKHFQ